MSKKRDKKHHKNIDALDPAEEIAKELAAERAEAGPLSDDPSPAGGDAAEGCEPEPLLDHPAIIDNAIAQLAPYHLNQRSQQELRSLMELLVHRKRHELAKPLRYGMLLQCDHTGYARDFLAVFSSILEKAKLLDAPPVFANEGDDPTLIGSKKASSLRVIKNCLPAPADPEKTAREDAHWLRFWSEEEETLKSCPDLIGVAVVSERAVRTQWKRFEHQYYRVYSHHIFLDDLPADDIRDLVLMELEDLCLETDEGFRQALEQYVRTVYPKADLKYMVFVKDLVDRILTLYYSSAVLEKEITARCIPFYHRPQGFEEALAMLNGMVGMEPVKRVFQDLYYQKRSRANPRTPLRLNMIFSGNPGTGKTTAARMAANILYSMGLIRTNKLIAAKSADLISPWVGKTAPQTRDLCRKAYGGVLFIDEAYMLAYSPDRGDRSANDDHKSQCVDTILQEMEENADKLTVIFAGYPEPMQKFLDSNEGLRSRITYIVDFPDHTEEQLLQIFEQLCAKDRFTVAEEAYPLLKSRLSFEKAGKDFGNARSVENIFNSIRAAWQMAPDEERIFTPAHIQSTMPEQRDSDIRNMIGLDDLKEQLLQFEKRAKYLKLLSDKGAKAPPMNLHMLFVGNPGTGKTTVAQIIADDLYKIGVLKTNKCICVETHDLIGSRVNAAEPLEQEIRRAMGGVLFLDEAYALTEYTYGNTGKEIVAALITAMEKYRGDLVVIFAGYPKNMHAFLNANPGLRSRIGHTFAFRDYSVQELTDIFLAKMQAYGFILSEGVTDRVREVMEYFHVIPEFGNGRFVDNLVDQTITCRAVRDDGDLAHYSEICADDIPSIKAVLDNMPEGWRYVDPAKISRDDKWRTAVHETGHALSAVLLEPEFKLTTVSTVGQAFSYGRIQIESPLAFTEEQLMHRISTALAGRAAERIVFGTHCTGCSSDFAKAKNIASNMLEHYAMGEKLGSRDITPLLNEANQTVMQLLEAHKDTLLALAKELLEKKELTDEDIRARLPKQPENAQPEGKTDEEGGT